MLTALVLSLALADSSRCVQLEVTTVGRSAHGSAIMVDSAPHQLIRALDRLPGWVEETPGISTARITRLEAAPAVNVIPRQATAILEISPGSHSLDDDLLIARLTETLGPKVEIEILETACGSRP